MRSSNRETVPVGKIIGVHGIKGEVKVLVYGGLEGFEWKTIFLKGRGGETACKVKRVRAHKGSLILELEGFSTRDASGPLVGLEVSVDKDTLPEPPEGEYYYFDLMGMEVVTEDGRDLGRIANVFSTGSNDVIEVDGPFGEVLIPALKETILKVDTENRRVTVRMMEGLIPGEGER